MYFDTSHRATRKFGSFIRWEIFASTPVTRLSRTRTSHASFTRRSQRWEPKNPAPPVTTARIPPPRKPPKLHSVSFGSAINHSIAPDTRFNPARKTKNDFWLCGHPALPAHTAVDFLQSPLLDSPRKVPPQCVCRICRGRLRTPVSIPTGAVSHCARRSLRCAPCPLRSTRGPFRARPFRTRQSKILQLLARGSRAVSSCLAAADPSRESGCARDV